MFIFNTPFTFTVHETPTEVAGPGAATPASTPQSGAPGQGPQNGDFWGMFPNVPEEHKALLEPHLRNHVLPYVNRLEEQYAPFKPFLERGLTAADAVGLLKFGVDFDKNPLDLWQRMGARLQEEGVIHEDLDFDALGKISRGEDFEDDEPVVPAQQPVNGQVPPELEAVVAPLREQITQLTGYIERQQEQERERQTTAQQQRQDELFNNARNTIRANLKQAGYPEKLLTNELIAGAIYATSGNAQAAEKMFADQRGEILKGFTEARPTQETKDLKLNNGVPTHPKPSQRRGGTRDEGWREARSGAEQYLATQVAGNEE